MKIDRAKVYDKYGGHCAYCGVIITIKQMQVDHLWPLCLSYRLPEVNLNRSENLMPSCRKCNNHKHRMQLEMWRSELALQVTRLRKNTQFDRALRFGQVKITECRIVFYFESVIGV
uniref:Putative homing endonuclease n=1 Tax=viral metagenome TaxID=1070528 RepID=A0A6M3JPD5_9ZZZZ